MNDPVAAMLNRKKARSIVDDAVNEYIKQAGAQGAPKVMLDLLNTMYRESCRYAAVWATENRTPDEAATFFETWAKIVGLMLANLVDQFPEQQGLELYLTKMIEHATMEFLSNRRQPDDKPDA